MIQVTLLSLLHPRLYLDERIHHLPQLAPSRPGRSPLLPAESRRALPHPVDDGEQELLEILVGPQDLHLLRFCQLDDVHGHISPAAPEPRCRRLGQRSEEQNIFVFNVISLNFPLMKQTC